MVALYFHTDLLVKWPSGQKHQDGPIFAKESRTVGYPDGEASVQPVPATPCTRPSPVETVGSQYLVI